MWTDNKHNLVRVAHILSWKNGKKQDLFARPSIGNRAITQMGKDIKILEESMSEKGMPTSPSASRTVRIG